MDGLDITSLSGEKRSAYARRWDAAQERFIDSPAQAVNMADSLVTAVAAERGYQAADDEFSLRTCRSTTGGTSTVTAPRG